MISMIAPTLYATVLVINCYQQKEHSNNQHHLQYELLLQFTPRITLLIMIIIMAINIMVFLKLTTAEEAASSNSKKESKIF